ncbi:FAD-dependent oxidoreductase [Geothrix sp. 21YS21S-4]|uniref:FAD-dependent oxidoreductase n=1 Tax=Geothrix sp. 21YS21S-4 TaxID=3068889 RepID=UPI0027B89255|nr:FAD-dependent oxidoreductase [Geothrix sp. 21YS21S-4]
MPEAFPESRSLWMTEAIPLPPALDRSVEADVCVVGAGIAGLTTAYLLARAGKSVVVLDKGPIGGGQTERTTAHLANAIDDRYVQIERLHGREGARLAAESHTEAIAWIEHIAEQEKIACDFLRVDGHLFLSPGDPLDLLMNELEAARRAGLSQVELLERAPLAGFDTGPCLRFPAQAQFHPLKYLAGLARGFTRLGGRIFSEAPVEKVAGGKVAAVTTRGGQTVTAAAVVVATNSPINDMFAMHTKQYAYRTYAISAPIPRGSVPLGLYWDTQEAYHYVRVQPGGDDATDFLIVGGEDHHTGHDDEGTARYGKLEAWARERFPTMGKVAFRWSGQVLETIDGLAFIGRNPMDADNVFIITGDSGMGMTHGTLGGILVSDLILGRKETEGWAKLYEPSRKTLRALGTFAKEASQMAWQYTDWLTPGEVASADEIPTGSGAILRRGLAKVAAYRDEKGLVHEVSATCPHLGGVVCWNAAERTWDCPCHGSRFDRLGKVIAGPAITDLAPAEEAGD